MRVEISEDRLVGVATPAADGKVTAEPERERLRRGGIGGVPAAHTGR